MAERRGRRDGDTPLTGTVRDVIEGVISLPPEIILPVLNDAAHRADAQRNGEEDRIIADDQDRTSQNAGLLEDLLTQTPEE